MEDNHEIITAENQTKVPCVAKNSTGHFRLSNRERSELEVDEGLDVRRFHLDDKVNDGGDE